MTFSMTGYGKHTCTYQGRVITIEVRTLNSKQGDFNLRIPSIYREKEFEIRDRISDTLYRGKIDLNIQRDLAPDESSSELNEALVEQYYQTLVKLEEKIGKSPSTQGTDYLNLIMKMPEVLLPATDHLEDEEWAVVSQGLDDCLARCQEFRQQEGAKLEEVLLTACNNILQALHEIEPLEAERIERIKDRIKGNLNDEVADQANFDRDRFEQELIYYMEKLDITEEKVRLKAHCEYFHETMKNEAFKGKKLSFISQEMGREINTLGSKAQHSQIQRIVVGMKDELEKIKEQVLNIL